MKFADDIKLFRKSKVMGDKHTLQDDIDKLVTWSENWQMDIDMLEKIQR